MHLYMSWYVTILTDATVFRRRPDGMTCTSIVLLGPGFSCTACNAQMKVLKHLNFQLLLPRALFFLYDWICITKACPSSWDLLNHLLGDELKCGTPPVPSAPPWFPW